MERGILRTPALYISYFLKRNRTEYYDRMSEVRRTGDYEQWVSFFLEAVYESALDATETIDKLAALHDKNAKIISGFGRAAANAEKLLVYLEENPIIEIGKTAAELGAAWGTMAAAVKRLCDAGILTKTGAGARKRTFAYGEYLNILRAGT
jgi:Fic family protein